MFGCVILGRNRKNGELVAIKISSKTYGSDIAEDPLQECLFMKEVDKGNQYIVNILDYYDTPLSIILVMEYLNGGELFRYISNQQYLIIHNRLDTFLKISKSVESVHKMGYAHMDISLENFLIIPNNDSIENSLKTIKICDFGVTQRHDHAVESSRGKLRYMSPEIKQVSQKIKYDARSSDIFSLGVVLFILLTNQYPFEENEKLNETSIKSKLLTIQELHGDQGSKINEVILSKMLDVDHIKRPVIAEVRREIQGMLDQFRVNNREPVCRRLNFSHT